MGRPNRRGQGPRRLRAARAAPRHDHRRLLRHHPPRGHPGARCRSRLAAGQPAIVGKVAMDRCSPADYAESTSDGVRDTEAFIVQCLRKAAAHASAAHPRGPLVHPAITPRFIPTGSPACSRASARSRAVRGRRRLRAVAHRAVARPARLHQQAASRRARRAAFRRRRAAHQSLRHGPRHPPHRRGARPLRAPRRLRRLSARSPTSTTLRCRPPPSTPGACSLADAGAASRPTSAAACSRRCLSACRTAVLASRLQYAGHPSTAHVRPATRGGAVAPLAHRGGSADTWGLDFDAQIILSGRRRQRGARRWTSSALLPSPSSPPRALLLLLLLPFCSSRVADHRALDAPLRAGDMLAHPKTMPHLNTILGEDGGSTTAPASSRWTRAARAACSCAPFRFFRPAVLQPLMRRR